jgi:predicted dehydrogenase
MNFSDKTQDESTTGSERLSSLEDDTVLKVAIMGLGEYGTKVADAMKDCKRAKLTGAISGTTSKVKEWQSKYNLSEKNCYDYENFDGIKDNPDIDAVYIITPNAQHYENCLRVAAAGKHVICEKPMAVSSKEAEEMVEVCRNAGVKLLIGYRMHFEANTLEIIKQRKQGEFGTIKFFNGLSGFQIDENAKSRLNIKKSGGGALMDIGIYAVNGSRYMIGEDPIWVTAQEVKSDPEVFKEGVDETITFQMGFPGGAIASCLSSFAMDYLDKFLLVGEGGFAEMQPATGYDTIHAWTHKGEIEVEHQNLQAVQMDRMAMIILDGLVPEIPVDGEEGVKDMKIIEGIYKAAKSGKKEVLEL